MPGALLRSGKLKDYKALGENGQPVYTSALQLREAIRLKLGLDAALCLAVPQSNETGDSIDWYAPELGDVVPWSSATNEERIDAKHQLETIHKKLAEASTSVSASTSREQQIFTRLLKKVIYFPDDGHVYLVNGKPVLTFWGFIDPQANADENPIGRLRMMSRAEPAIGNSGEPPQPLVAELTEKKRFSWWWLLLPLLLTLLTLWLLRSCAQSVLPPEIAAPVEQVTRDSINYPRNWVNEKNNTFADAISSRTEDVTANSEFPQEREEFAPQISEHEQDLPLDSEQPFEQPVEPNQPEQPIDAESSADEQQPEIPEKTSSDQQPPIPPDTPLGIPADAVQNGSTNFLNGAWKAAGGIQDAQTGRPMKMEYDFKEGKGKVKVSNGAGRECVGDVSASMGGGGLSIDNQGQAKCNDGTTYSLPAVKCNQGATTAADCTGSYADNEFPISIKKN